MSFMFRDRKDIEDVYSNEMSFDKDELDRIRDHYDFLGDYILDKEVELKRLYAERKCALFTLKKFGMEV